MRMLAASSYIFPAALALGIFGGGVLADRGTTDSLHGNLNSQVKSIFFFFLLNADFGSKPPRRFGALHSLKAKDTCVKATAKENPPAFTEPDISRNST